MLGIVEELTRPKLSLRLLSKNLAFVVQSPGKDDYSSLELLIIGVLADSHATVATERYSHWHADFVLDGNLLHCSAVDEFEVAFWNDESR